MEKNGTARNEKFIEAIGICKHAGSASFPKLDLMSCARHELWRNAG
jgi:hypothetical protein